LTNFSRPNRFPAIRLKVFRPSQGKSIILLEDKLSKAQHKPQTLSAKPDLPFCPPLKVGLTTLGCKVNQCESAALAEDLQGQNFSLVPFSSCADIYIINTCTVTAFSNFQSRQLIRRAHRTNPQAKILVTGCYAQIASSEIAAIEGVSLVVGNDRKNTIVDLLCKDSGTSTPFPVKDIFRQKEFCDMPIARFRKRNRAFLKIQDGCNSFCSYCIVPFARGRSRSLSPQNILEATARFAQKGHREIVLTGIHLGVYGRDLPTPTTLSSLVSQILDQDANTRIRLSSIEPGELTGDLLCLFNDSNKRLCPHLHIPLQSGDDKILKLMNRDYNALFYRKLIEKISLTGGNIAIGADVMVGFPSEGEKEFNNTLQLLQDLPIAYLHVFPYSERPGTAAQKLLPKVPETVKKERAAILRELSARKREEFALDFLGKPLQVLVEETKDKKTGLLKGFSQNYLHFFLEENNISAINKIVTVQAEKYQEGKLYGKIVS
jgi:threonylcarbamoyladenosine tRNA methylthiotransferase MtaB